MCVLRLCVHACVCMCVYVCVCVYECVCVSVCVNESELLLFISSIWGIIIILQDLELQIPWCFGGCDVAMESVGGLWALTWTLFVSWTALSAADMMDEQRHWPEISSEVKRFAGSASDAELGQTSNSCRSHDAAKAASHTAHVWQFGVSLSLECRWELHSTTNNEVSCSYVEENRVLNGINNLVTRDYVKLHQRSHTDTTGAVIGRHQ